MTLNEWRKTVASWTVERANNPKRVALPTDVELDAFECEFDFRLPDSYRRFANLMGAGTLARHVTFYTPSCDVRTFDMIWQNKQRRKDWKGFAAAVSHDVAPADMPQLERLLVMSDFVYDDNCFWDPADATPGPGHECGIYLLRRIPKRAEKVADTFDSFVLEFCLGTRFHDFYTRETRDCTPDGSPVRNWQHLLGRQTKKPKKAD